MANKIKRQHFVPQAYLKAFAIPGRGDPQVWVTSKTREEPARRRISRVAVESYLYSPKDAEGERDYATEKKLAQLEELLGGAPWRQISTGFVDLSWDAMRKCISLIAATMFLRNPLRLAATKSIHGQIVQSVLDAGGPDEIEAMAIGDGPMRPIDASDWERYRSADADEQTRMWLKHLHNASWLATKLMAKRWSVIVSDNPVFVTSDNPVSLHNSRGTNAGFDNEDVMILFPLSPTRVLMMDNRLAEMANQYYPAHSPAQTNGLIWRAAIDEMYSHRHSDEVCREMVENYERWKAPPKRWTNDRRLSRFFSRRRHH